MKRPLKITLIVVLCLFGLLFTANLGLCAYFYLRTDNAPAEDDSDLLLPEETIPDEDNACVALLSVTNQLEAVSSDDLSLCHAYAGICTGVTNKWEMRRVKDVDALRTNVDRILVEQAPLFDQLHKVATCPRYRLVCQESEIIQIPPISDMMRAAQLWRAKAFREMERGGEEDALATIRECLAFGSKIRDDYPLFVELYVGTGICEMIYEAALRLALNDQTSERVRREVVEMLSKTEPNPERVFARSVRSEYSSERHTLEKISALMTSDGRKDTECPYPLSSFLRPAFARWALRKKVVSRFVFQPERTRDAHARYIRAVLAGADAENALPKVQGLFQPNCMGICFLRMLAPAVQDTRARFFRHVFKLRAERTALAVDAYRRANDGVCPPSLESLVPGYLPAVPKDPFAPDRALCFDGTHNLVWSVGLEGTFNPLPARTNSLSRLERDMRSYAMRLDLKSM